jgi:hypothetical protein
MQLSNKKVSMNLILILEMRQLIMLSKINYITPSVNMQNWKLDLIGLQFENYIWNIMKRQLSNWFDAGLKIIKTENSRDGGKDIVIESRVEFTLFGIPFYTKGKESIKVFVECKSSNDKKISLEKFSKNLLIAGNEVVDYFVLVTNTTLSPFSFYQAKKTANDYSYEFILIDQFLLVNFLNDCKAMVGEYERLLNKPAISMEYQVEKAMKSNKPCFELYVTIRNYQSVVALCDLKLVSDRNWLISKDKHKIIIDGNKGESLKLIVQKEYIDGINDVILQFEINDERKIVEIKGDGIYYDFEPPMVGNERLNKIQKIREAIFSNSAFMIYNIYGEAGIGKTRFINETLTPFLNREFVIIPFLCEKKERCTTIKELCKEMSSKIPVLFRKEINSLPILFSEICDEFTKYIIIIEDIHNADKEFFDELLQLAKEPPSTTALNIILSGRDDHTVHNEDFFSFLEWIETSEEYVLNNYKILPLNSEECKTLINLIIKDVPDIVLDKLQTHSNNNPFYIVQFIEYLLDTKLVHLLTRNTVGIFNASGFSSKLYIPSKIEIILKKRFEELSRREDGGILQSFLLICAYWGHTIPKHIAIGYFTENMIEGLEFLIRRRFLSFSDSGDIRFHHENIYLFTKKLLEEKNNLKHISLKIKENSALFSKMSVLKQGKIYCALEQYEDARRCFKTSIEEISNMENISSVNLSPYYFDYIDEIFFISRYYYNKETQQATLLAALYIAMHNLELGQALRTFERVYKFINKYNLDDGFLPLKVRQLQSHLFLHTGMLSSAKRIMLELLTEERKSSDLFDDETRFNLFDRAASLYIHYNHKKLAEDYNQMSFQVAQKIGSKKLLTLAKIVQAKIMFFTNTSKSLEIMQEARRLLSDDMVERINCHNDIGILTAKILLSNERQNFNTLITEAVHLQHEAIRICYPLSIIRIHLLLAHLYYRISKGADIWMEKAKRHISLGIDACIRYGITKLIYYFYNYKAIISAFEKQSTKDIYNLYETMLMHLRQQDMLFLGALDFCYGNIVCIHNYATFLLEYKLESEWYRFCGMINYYGSDSQCDYNCSKCEQYNSTCTHSIDLFKKMRSDIKKEKMFIVKKKYPLKDDKTSFYLPLHL